MAVNEAVKAGKNELDLEAEGCYRTVSLWESDEHLKALCDAMNSRREKKIRYVFGEAEEFLTGETMASWITGVSEEKITVDQEKAAAFIKDLASRYDTAGTARTSNKGSRRSGRDHRPLWLEDRSGSRDGSPYGAGFFGKLLERRTGSGRQRACLQPEGCVQRGNGLGNYLC